MKATRGRGRPWTLSRTAAIRARRSAISAAPVSWASSAAATRVMSASMSASESGLRETVRTGRSVQVQVAASTSLRLTAHTSQWSWVTITSGSNARSASASTRYTDSPSRTIALTRLSISALVASTLNLGSVSAGSARTSPGKSHSWLRPTSQSRRPSAQTISVALAIRLTTRRGVSIVTSLGLPQIRGTLFSPHPSVLTPPLTPPRQGEGKRARIARRPSIQSSCAPRERHGERGSPDRRTRSRRDSRPRRA